MIMFLLVSCLCLSVVYTTASTVKTDQNIDTMEYLISRIAVLDDSCGEEINAMRIKQDRQAREIASLRRVLERRIGYNGQGEEDNVNENEQPRAEVNDAASTDGGNFHSAHAIHRKRTAELDSNVAFFAKLSVDIHHLGRNQTVAFDNIEVNEGNAYDPNTGVFTAPVAGTYVFSTTVVTKGRDVTHYGFYHNGILITRMRVDGAESYYESSSQTIVLQLNQGDDVSIKHTGSDKTITGANYSIFSGFLQRRSVLSITVVNEGYVNERVV